MSAILETNIKGARLLNRGKVRDIYEIDDKHLMLVVTDRISAFDVVLDKPIPDKGAVLTQISNFWFERFRDITPNHLSGKQPSDFISDPDSLAQLDRRAVVVKKAEPLAIECIVRGYIVGSGWKEYQKEGTVCGIPLPAGLEQAAKLPEPLFTPSTKAEQGEHDENISPERAAEIVGKDIAQRVAELSIRLYSEGAKHAAAQGIILADTKFEFGMLDGELILIDEVLTPDSSRFWPADEYRTGISPPSFDKQFVRDWLETLDWDKRPPAPPMPDEIVEKTAEKYREAYRRITGQQWRS
jgi:phosphoribosylaminoimidazole-succinocarboxamide synthase